MTLEELQKLKELQALNSERSTIARAGVGLANALVGFGGSPDVAASAIKRGGDYLKATEPDPIKDLKVVDVDGTPTYLDIKNANMEQAYVAPKGGSTGPAKGVFQALPTYDPVTKKYGTKLLNTGTGELSDLGIIARPVAEKPFRMEDIQGNVTQNTFNQYDKSSRVSPLVTTKGLGAHYNVDTKEQGQQIEKNIGKASEKYQEVAESLADVKNSKGIIATTNDPRLAASAIYDMVRRIELKGVLTDQDFITITGSDKMTFFARLKEAADINVFGDVQSVLNTYGPLIDNLERKLQSRIKNIPQTYIPQTQQGQSGFKNVVPQDTAVKSSTKGRILDKLKGY